MLSAVGGLWTLLSLIVAGLSTFSFLQPYWFIHRRTLHSLGMYSFCLRDDLVYQPTLEKGPFTQACGLYGGYFDFVNLPSNAWQVACVLYGGGCGVLVICALLSILVLCMPSKWDTKMAAVTGYIQTTAGLGRINLPVPIPPSCCNWWYSGLVGKAAAVKPNVPDCMFEMGSCVVSMALAHMWRHTWPIWHSDMRWAIIIYDASSLWRYGALILRINARWSVASSCSGC